MKEGSADDLGWLMRMAMAWGVALAAPSLEFALGQASLNCQQCDETRFFETVLRPIIEHRFGRQPAPKFSAPLFIPHAFA